MKKKMLNFPILLFCCCSAYTQFDSCWKIKYSFVFSHLSFTIVWLEALRRTIPPYLAIWIIIDWMSVMNKRKAYGEKFHQNHMQIFTFKDNVNDFVSLCNLNSICGTHIISSLKQSKVMAMLLMSHIQWQLSFSICVSFTLRVNRLIVISISA